MRLLILSIAAVAAYAQVTGPLKVSQGSGSIPGEIWLQEPRSGGANWLKLKAPALSADTTLTLPASLASFDGQCITGTTGGVLSWGTCSGVTVVPSDYDWSQTITAPGAAGTHTITLTPGPVGVSATDTASQYWLSGTAGADEAVTSTGTGTCDGTAQASCTIQVVTAHSHTGTTTIRSGSAGAQEAINAATNAVTLAYPIGAFNWTTRACVNGKKVTFLGQGMGTSITLTTPGQMGICKLSDAELEVRRLSIVGDTTTTGIYVQSPSANGGSDRIVDSFIQNHAVGINHRTATETYIVGNRFYGNEIGLATANEISNDQGGLYVYDNNFQGSGSSTSQDILYHGPGGAKFRDNWFLGARDSFVADGTMATVNVSGTTVTAVSGRFYPLWVGWTMYIDGNPVTISGYTNSTTMTIGSSLGTLTGVQLGQSTGQLEFRGGNFDNQQRSGISFTGKTPFGGIKIIGSGFSNFFGAEKYTAISLTNPKLDQVSIENNRFGNLAGTTYDNTGIYGTYTGTALAITGNKFRAHKYSIDLDLAGTTNSADNLIAGNTLWGGDESGTIGVRLVNALRTKVSSNYIYNYRTGVSVSGASAAEVSVNGGGITCGSSATAVSFGAGTGHSVVGTDIGTNCSVGVAASTGTTVAIEGMTGTATTRASAAGSAVVRDAAQDSVVRSAITNTTTDMNGLSHYTSGTAATGFGLRVPVVLQDAGGTGIIVGGMQWSWVNPSTGVRTPQLDLLISKANTLYIGAQMDADLNWISKGSLYTSIGSVTGRFGANLNSGAGIGTFSAHPLSLYTDSAARWVVTSTGMFQPATTDTYDIGDLTTPKRVRGLYAKILDTALSGGTGDYIQTRKLQLFDNTGSSTGASYWDVNVVMSGVGAFQNSYFYIRDNAGSNVVKMERIASGSAVSRTTWYTDLLPDTTGGRNLGSTSLKWNGIWANQLGDVSNTVVVYGGNSTFSAITAPVLTINTASAPAIGDVWTATSTGGAGAWATPSGSSQWTTSGSNIYRSTGVVTIGHTSPTVRLGETLSLDYSSDFSGMAINTWSATAGHGGVIDFNKSASATKGTHNTVSSGDTLGFFVFRGSDGASFQRAAEVDGEVDASVSSGIVPGRLRFRTANTSGTMTERMKIDSAGLVTIPGTLLVSTSATISALTMAGNQTPGIDSLGSIGTSSVRYGAFYGYTGNFAGAVTMSGSTITASSTFSSDLIATTGSTYALGSSSVRWLAYLSTLNVSSTFTLNGSITGDLKFTSSNTYVLGDSTNYLNAAHVNTYQVYGQVKPASGVTTADLGGSTSRFRKLWTGDINANGTITAPDGNTGVSATKTVRDSAGTGTCTLIFSGGLLTGGTC